mgnify:CR=1 FL=1
MKTPEKQIVNLEDRPDLAALVEHVTNGYLTHAAEIRRDGEPVAVLLDPEAARCALAIAERFRERRPPFTQDALNKWLDEVLEGLDVSEFMAAHP